MRPRRPALALLTALVALAAPSLARAGTTEVVVMLNQPSLAGAAAQTRALASTGRAAAADPRSPFARGYLERLDARQDAVAARIARTIAGAEVRRRYAVVLNALSVSLPDTRLGQLRRVAGVASIQATVRYRGLLDRSPGLIGAPAIWGPSLSNAGQGVKIAILDDGIDQRHPFFDGRGYAMPAGFPKGQSSFTSAKVIVARAFAPRSPSYRYASTPFDPDHSGHAMHVAGIAAGNSGTAASAERRGLSGVAPAAYLGNYKVLTIPTASGVGLDGNSAEIAAAIEAAVRDGMDVINLSIGEPEIAPQRDLVVQAIEGAVRAGVVVVVSAGNDFAEFGRGTIGSPGSAASAITVGATTKGGELASFSSAGPTPISFGLKPDVSAPGVSILSSVPQGDGTWDTFSGTSMAAPHIAGAAAVLLQRNPSWTPAQVKSALVQTAEPIPAAGPARQGGGIVRLERAVVPLLFAAPTGVSFGSLRPGRTASARVALTDAGGGGGSWAVSVDVRDGRRSATVGVPASATVPGTLQLTLRGRATSGEVSGYVVLTRGADRRRIPYWALVAAPRLGAPAAILRRNSVISTSNRGRPARVSRYRYPDDPSDAGVTTRLAGPELVYRVRVTRPVANFGVAIVSQAPGVQIEPRIVAAGDENRLTGYTALPLNLNPYLADFLEPRRVAGVVLPIPGLYDVVFDSPSRAAAGRFRFRFWMNDAQPPTLRVLGVRSGSLVIQARDAGSGIDPESLVVQVDGSRVDVRLSRDRVLVSVRGLERGRHRLVVRSSDYQETRNMEDVPRILPNTRELRTTFVVR